MSITHSTQITIGSKTYNIDVSSHSEATPENNEKLGLILNREPVDLELINGLWKRTNPVSSEDISEDVYQVIGAKVSSHFSFTEDELQSEDEITNQLSDGEAHELAEFIAQKNRNKLNSSDEK